MDFMSEIQLMKEIGYHENVLQILGCCTVRHPLCLITEFAPYGDLLTYLRKLRDQVRKTQHQLC